MVTHKNEDGLDKKLVKLVQEKKPTNVKELINLTKLEAPSIPEKQIKECILQLESQGKITLKKQSRQTSPKLSTYLQTTEVTWYWITIILSIITTLTVFTIQENSSPLIYIRNVLGAIFVIFLPGYSFIKALFPKKELDNIERIALSIGMSLALVPITGLVLNYTPLGIRTTTITISLLTLTIIFATIATIREHQSKL